MKLIRLQIMFLNLKSGKIQDFEVSITTTKQIYASPELLNLDAWLNSGHVFPGNWRYHWQMATGLQGPREQQKQS